MKGSQLMPARSNIHLIFGFIKVRVIWINIYIYNCNAYNIKGPAECAKRLNSAAPLGGRRLRETTRKELNESRNAEPKNEGAALSRHMAFSKIPNKIV